MALGLAPKTSIMTPILATVLNFTAERGGTTNVTIQTSMASTLEVRIHPAEMELDGITGTGRTILLKLLP